MKVKAPFIVYPNANVLACLVLVKVRTFTSEHPEGKLTLAPIYAEAMALPSNGRPGS